MPLSIAGPTLGQIAAAHSVAHSLVSNRKTSTISDQKSKDKHHAAMLGGGKAGMAASSGEGTSQVLMEPHTHTYTRVHVCGCMESPIITLYSLVCPLDCKAHVYYIDKGMLRGMATVVMKTLITTTWHLSTDFPTCCLQFIME